MNDATDEQPGKTGEMDESIQVESPWLCELLRGLKMSTGPEQSLWDFTMEQVRIHFKTATEELGLQDGRDHILGRGIQSHSASPYPTSGVYSGFLSTQ